MWLFIKNILPVFLLCFLAVPVLAMGEPPPERMILQKGYIDGATLSDDEITALMSQKVRSGFEDARPQGVSLHFAQSGEKAIVENCTEYFAKTSEGYSPYTTFDLTMESYFIRDCYPLLFMRTAILPRYSNFSAPVFEEGGLGLLPAALGQIFKIGDREICEEEADFEACLKAEIDGFDSSMLNISPYEIAIDAPDRLAGYKIMAAGDFNQDGWQDLLLFTHYVSKEGSYRSYGNFCLEQPNDQKIPSVFDCFAEGRF